jgi:hypothetical protein
MNHEQRIKINNSLIFEHSDLWDSVMLILDEAIKSEVSVAISQQESEANRAHSCGRADGVMFIKELLENTRDEAKKISGRKS